MDKKLKLLKTYIEGRIKAYERLTGAPLGDNVLELRMLVNSDPGLIRIFAGPIEPSQSRAREVDVWFDGKVFKEKALTGWNQFDVYHEEFTTTILDAFSEQFPVDVPIAIEIDGPTFIDRTYSTEALYRVYMTLESGRRVYLDEAVLEVFDRSNRAKMTTDENGIGTLDLTKVTNTSNLSVKATFRLGDFAVLSAELPVQAFVEGTTFNETYKLDITGPDTIRVGQSGTYRVHLTTEFLDTGEIKTEEVTSQVVLSSATLGSFTGNAFAPEDDGTFDRNADIIATLTKTLGNGSTFDITGSLTITIFKMTVQDVFVNGPDTVKENNAATYTARIMFRNGEEATNLVPVWGILDSSLGSINQSGIFAAPMVAADAPQTISASVVFEGTTYRGDKQILVLDVMPPVMTISGPASMYDNETKKFFAQISFEGITVDVIPDWSVVDATHGAFNADVNGDFTAQAMDANATATLRANTKYRGYDVVAEAPTLIYTTKLFPMIVTINGARVVKARSTTQLVAIAVMSDGTEVDVSSQGRWTINNARHTISGNGTLNANDVNENILVDIGFEFTQHSKTVLATHRVEIEFDPIVWIPESLSITGPDTINELTTEKYSANVRMVPSEGDPQVFTDVEVQWIISGFGTVSANGQLSATEVGRDEVVNLTAIYNDGKNTPKTDTIPVTVKNVALLTSLELTFDESVLFTGDAANVVATLTKRDGSTVDVAGHANTKYTFSPLSVATISKTTKKLTAGAVVTDVTLVVTATYTEAGETVYDDASVMVRVSAGALVINPPSLDLFEGDTETLVASLVMDDGTLVPVQATFDIPPECGTIDENGLFTAAQVTEELITSITASFTGDVTGGTTIRTIPMTIVVRNNVPELLEVYNDGGVYSVEEGGSLVLKTRTTYSRGTVVENDPNVVFSIRGQDEAYAQLVPGQGTVRVNALDILENRQVPVFASLPHAEVAGGVVNGERLVILRYVKALQAMNLSIDAGPYNKDGQYRLTLAERFDDNSTQQVTDWRNVGLEYDSNLINIVDGNVVIKASSGSVSIRASRGALTSNTVNFEIAQNVPASLQVYSSDGTTGANSATINRGVETILNAAMIMTNGANISPNSTWPVTWTWTPNPLVSVVVNDDYTITVTAADVIEGGSVDFVATCSDVTETLTLTIVGFAVATGAHISGPNTLESGKTEVYELIVSMSDGSTQTFGGTSGREAAFEIEFSDPLFTVPGSITPAGVFVAPEHEQETNIIGMVHAAVELVAGEPYVTATPFEVAISRRIPVTPVSATITGPATMQPDSIHPFTMNVIMSDGSTLLINKTSTKTATWSANAGTITNGEYHADATPTGYSAVIFASFEQNGVSVEDTLTVPVTPIVATTLRAHPTSINVFEGKSVEVEITTSTGVTIANPTFVLTVPTVGAMDGNMFNAAQVSEDTDAILVASYTGPETGGNAVSINIDVRVKDIFTDVVELDGSDGLSILEGESKTFRSKVTLIDGTVISPEVGMAYEIVGNAPSGVTLTTNANGTVTINAANVIVSTGIMVKASYTDADGRTVSGNTQVNLTDATQQVVDLVVTVVEGKNSFFEGETANFEVRQRYDNSQLSSPITAGVTWSLNNSAFATMTGNAALMATANGDKQLVLTPSYQGITASAPVTITVVDIVPASIAITSDKALIKRGETAELTATITYNNGTTGVATGTANRVTWTNSSSAAATFTAVGGKYRIAAKDIDVDMVANVTATSVDKATVDATFAQNIDGYPVPVSSVINGLAEVASGSATTPYSMLVTYSDASTKTVNAASIPKGSWSATHDMTGTTGGINATTGVFTPGESWNDRPGNISVSWVDPVSGITVTKTKSVKILSKPVQPLSVTVVGPTTVEADSTETYVGTVTMNNGTTITLDANATVAAGWSTTIVGATIVKGVLTASAEMADQVGRSVAVSFTQNGRTVTGAVTDITANGAAPVVAPGAFEDAVYVGAIPTMYGVALTDNNAATVTSMQKLLTEDRQTIGGKMLAKRADLAKEFSQTSIDLHFWRDVAGTFVTANQNVTERLVILYPTKYGKYAQEKLRTLANGIMQESLFTDAPDPTHPMKMIRATNTSGDINPTGEPLTINLPVGGVSTPFYVYLYGGTTGMPSSTQTTLTVVTDAIV